MGNANGKVEQGELIELRISVENDGTLDAQAVRLDLSGLPEGMEANPLSASLGTVPREESTAPSSFVLNVNRRIEPGPVVFARSQSHRLTFRLLNRN